MDEYRIVFDKTSGEILLSRNNDPTAQPRILTFADPNQTFYPFLFLNGRITALSVFALIASNVHIVDTNLNPSPRHVKKKESSGNDSNGESGDESDPCTICYDVKATYVLLPCGHMIFCAKCKEEYEKTSEKICPKCRAKYQQAIEVQDD